MKKLKELGFIDIKAGKSGPLSYALIYNPHHVLRQHYEAKTPGLIEASFTALIERALDIGANDTCCRTRLESRLADPAGGDHADD